MRVQRVSLGCTIAMLSVVLVLLVSRASAAETAMSPAPLDGGWIDEFSIPTLNDRWQWVREDNSHWSLSAHSGFLRITTQDGSLFGPGGTGKNVLITPATLADFQIETKVTIAPGENFQAAELLVYQDDDNYVQIGRRYANGDKVRFRIEIGGIQSQFDVNEAATTVWLRIIKFNDLYVGSYSIDGSDWTEVGGQVATLSSPKVGITANSGPSLSEIPADFDYFEFSPPATLYVAPGGNCGGTSPCYASIQAAVDAAGIGDVIKVATGVYTGVQGRPAPPGYPYPWPAPTEVVTQVVYISKTVAIRGGYAAPGFSEPPDPVANPTTVDAQHHGRGIFITRNTDPTVEGLRIMGGGLEGHPCLGREPGGGVYVDSTAVTIQDNWFSGNWGGGLFVRDSAARVSGNVVTGNEACDGGGLTLEGSDASISGNLFSSNDATSGGGGIWLVGSDATLVNNVVIDNTASWGGGVVLLRCDATLVNNAVLDNMVYEGASGLFVVGSSSRLLHNTIAHNTGADGSGIRVEDDTEEGIHSTVSLSNTILANHSVGIHAAGSSTVAANGILWHNTPTTVSKADAAVVTVNNEFVGNPFFAPDGFHLLPNSAAINKGVNAGVAEDIDGESRPSGFGYELGADEIWLKSIYLPLVRK